MPASINSAELSQPSEDQISHGTAAPASIGAVPKATARQSCMASPAAG
jgi:hypothetical protein